MYLKKVSFSGIRNLKPETLELSQGINFIVGNNGQGKTSILEAIFLLSHAKSFRSPSVKSVVSRVISVKPKDITSEIIGEVIHELGTSYLGIKINGGKRELFKNEKKLTSATNYIGSLKTVLFTPEDLELIKGAPAIRRQFIDRVLVMVSEDYTKTILEYIKIIKIRNQLLHAGNKKEATLFNSKLSFLNFKICKERFNLIENLKDNIRSIYQAISGEPEEIVTSTYKSNFINELKPMSEEEIFSLFNSTAEKDFILKRTNLGIHKDEIFVEFKSGFGEGSSREVSSQGQARTKSVAFKLASAAFIEERTGSSPVLLLDDVEGELDDKRRENLFKYLSSLKSQVLITGTRKPPEKSIKINNLVSVINGELKLINS